MPSRCQMNHNQETSKEAQPGRVNLFPAIAQVDGPHLNPQGQAFWRNGGARRVRTDDLMLAKHALYQLSYGPLKDRKALQNISSIRLPKAPQSRWWAQADSNCRPHAYQACALTN